MVQYGKKTAVSCMFSAAGSADLDAFIRHLMSSRFFHSASTVDMMTGKLSTPEMWSWLYGVETVDHGYEMVLPKNVFIIN